MPYTALPQVGKDYAASIKGKVVLDTSNPIQSRDGEMAVAAREKGTGVASAEFLPGARLVRAFNEVGYRSLRSESNRAGDKVAIPLAADDKEALEVAIRLVKEAGFEPVVVGGLETAKTFDVGTPVFGKALTAAELRRGTGYRKIKTRLHPSIQRGYICNSAAILMTRREITCSPARESRRTGLALTRLRPGIPCGSKNPEGESCDSESAAARSREPRRWPEYSWPARRSRHARQRCRSSPKRSRRSPCRWGWATSA